MKLMRMTTFIMHITHYHDDQYHVDDDYEHYPVEEGLTKGLRILKNVILK